MKNKLFIFSALLFLSVGFRLNAQSTHLERAFEVANNYYRLLNIIGSPESNAMREAAVDSLNALFYSKTYSSNIEHVEQLVELDLGDTLQDDNLEHYLSQIGAFLSKDQRVHFFTIFDKERSFCYGVACDTVLVYLRKTVVVEGEGGFEREHDEVLTVVDGRIVRVGTPAYASIYDKTVRELMERAEDIEEENVDVYYNKAYDYLTMMYRRGWRFAGLYDDMAGYLYNTNEEQLGSAGFTRLNLDSLALLARGLCEGVGCVNLASAGKVVKDLGIKNYDTYLSLYGHEDVHTGSGNLVVFTREDGSQGYVNLNGDTVVKPRFEQAQRFEEGLAAAKRKGSSRRSGQYGLINQRGVWKLRPQYDRIYSMPDYKAYVIEQDGKYGAMSYKGKGMVRPRYDEPVVFLNEEYAACCKDGKWGLVNRWGMEEVECQYDGLEIIGVEDGVATYRYNGVKIADTKSRTFGAQIGRVMRHSRWSGGPIVGGSGVTMNIAGAVYSLLPAVYYLAHQPSGRGDDIEDEDVHGRWFMPNWQVLYTDAWVGDGNDSSLLSSVWGEGFATYRFGYSLSWKSHLWPVGVVMNASYELNRWGMKEGVHKVQPVHKTQAVVLGFGLRYRPLGFRRGGALTPVAELGFSYVYNVKYSYRGGFFDDWGYRSGDGALRKAVNNGWRWNGLVGLAWGYAMVYAKYERDMYDVFNEGFVARDASKPMAGWRTKLGVVSVGLTLAF